MKTIRVMIVDDHDMLREGLATFLKAFDDMRLVGEAAHGEAAIQLCREVAVDIILMDLVMPGLGGVAAIERIHREFPAVGIVALSSFDDAELVRQALRAGARSYLLKSISADRLADAIRSTHAGLPTFGPEITQAFLTGVPATTGRPEDSLTDREKQVLDLVARGLTNAQLAQELHITPSTVKNHLLSIFNKLGVNNRTEAARVVLQKPV